MIEPFRWNFLLVAHPNCNEYMEYPLQRVFAIKNLQMFEIQYMAWLQFIKNIVPSIFAYRLNLQIQGVEKLLQWSHNAQLISAQSLLQNESVIFFNLSVHVYNWNISESSNFVYFAYRCKQKHCKHCPQS